MKHPVNALRRVEIVKLLTDQVAIEKKTIGQSLMPIHRVGDGEIGLPLLVQNVCGFPLIQIASSNLLD